jgi:hypothetical protein
VLSADATGFEQLLNAESFEQPFFFRIFAQLKPLDV